MEEKKAIQTIDFLNNKKEALLVNIQIQESKLQTITVIFISGIACILGLTSSLSVKELLTPCAILFLVYFICLIKKWKDIKILSKKIFCIRSLIRGIYERDLKVDRDEIEEILRKNYNNFKNLIKRAKKRKVGINNHGIISGPKYFS